MDEKNITRETQAMSCRDSRETQSQPKTSDRDYKERVREASERIRANNREILNRLATK